MTTQPNVTLGQIWKFTRHYWSQNLLLIGFVTASILFCTILNNYYVPLYIAHITDQISVSKPDNVVAAHDIWHSFSVFVALSLGQSVLWTIGLLVWNVYSARTLHRVIGDALFKVQRFSADWHTNAFAGGTVRKITRGMGAFDVLKDRLIIGLFTIWCVMFITVAALMTRQPYVGLFVLGITFLYFFLSLYVSKKYLVPLFRNAATADTQVGSTLADIITGIPTVKSFAGEDREDDLFKDVRDNWRQNALKAWQIARYVDSGRTILRLLMLAGMLGITLWMWGQGRATPGDVAMVLTCFFMTQHLLRDLGTQINDIQKALSEMEDIVDFWQREDDVKDIPHAKPLHVTKGGGAITFDHVRFSYQKALQPVYEDLSVTIRAGEKVALVGMSGSGKSTFVKLLQRLYDIQGGAISIDGQNIADVTQQSLRANIALVPQDPILFHRSLADNIAYARPDATQDQIENAAKLAFAHDFIMRTPNGYGTLVGERGVKLSGGERQRVAVARAILADTPILVLDEATSSLDSVSEHYIQQGLDYLMQGRTTITIAHRLATIRVVDRILVFDQGKIVEQGAHDALLANPQSLYKRLYDMQALGLIDAA